MNGVDNFTYQADPSGFQVGRRNIPVTIIQDSELEGDETFDLQLVSGPGNSPENVQILPPGSTTPGTSTVTYTVTIRDDENAPPTASNSAVRTYANTDYTFAARDFKFADTDMDDALVSVKIVTLPASGKGTLKLNNTAIVETALPKTVTETELGQNKLVYSPPPMDMIGEDFASFTFRVSDGDVDSSDTYTMTVYVLPPITTLVSNLGRGSGNSFTRSGPVYRLTEITKRQQAFTTGTNELRLRTDLDNVCELSTSLVGRSPPDAGAGSRHPQRQRPGTPGPMLFTFDNPSNIGSISSIPSLTSRSALRNLQPGLSAQHHLLDHAPCHRQLNASDISYVQDDGREHREEARTTGALSSDALLGRERGSNSAWTYTTDDFDPSR